MPHSTVGALGEHALHFKQSFSDQTETIPPGRQNTIAQLALFHKNREVSAI